MTVRVFVPGDSGARAVGADEVAVVLAAEAASRGLDVAIVRNGSRGLYWLEPLVEVQAAGGRVAYGPVGVDDVTGLLDAGLLDGAPHPLGHGPTEDIGWLASQQRVTFARVGVVDPRSADDFEAHGGLVGLRAALACPRPTSWRRSSPPGSAVAAAPASRPGSSGAPWPRRPRR